MTGALPIDSVLQDIDLAIASSNRLVLAAPPGAGKTTRVPLHLLQAGALGNGKLLLLEPRRIAARGAALRMAEQVGERLGETVGLATRLERKVSARTRIEVITDGLFARRILSDPELGGVACVVFDEVHERSLNVDLGLALALDVQEALREDLRIVLMSATLQTGKISERIGARVVTSRGRAFQIETVYAGRAQGHLEPHMAKVIRRALSATDGSILAFLPGAGEIRRTAELLEDGHLSPGTEVHRLYGALSPAQQDAAVRPPAPGQRKIVLSTDIAESAITIEGVSTVVDSGLARSPVHDPNGGTPRLVTERASLASVDQRRGRAGRTGPGTCYRLWDEAETRGLTPDITPEILRSDLSGLVLSLCEWGERDPTNLTWLDAPPSGRVAAARRLLSALGALDDTGALTPRGREMARLPLPPRLGALVASGRMAGARALGAEIAALLSERGLGGRATDLSVRLKAFRADPSPRAVAMRRQARSWGGAGKPAGDPAKLLASAWPEALARRRKDARGQFLTAGGEAVKLAEEDPLAAEDWLVVAEALGGARGARATLVAPISEADAMDAHPPQTEEVAGFDIASGRIIARKQSRIGAILLSEQPLPKPSGETARLAILHALSDHGWAGLKADADVDAFLARLAFARARGGDLPDWNAQALARTAGDWLLPEGLSAVPSPKDILAALSAHLGWPGGEELKALAPERLALPSGRSAPVDYLDEKAPLVSARVQEVYGLKTHPTLGRSGVPVTLSLNSPAGRQVALTADLPGFWKGGYLDMAKDMRARYPKHDWPDDPGGARPHEGRTKARLQKGQGRK